MRGRHAPKHKLSDRVKEIVVENINSHLSIKKMFGDLKEKNPDIKLHYETLYITRKFVRGMNISFTKLGEEECDACEAHKHHECTMKEGERGEKEGRPQKDSSEGEQLGERNDQTRKDGDEHQKDTDSEGENGCNACEAHQLHLVRANQSRTFYRADVALNNDPTKTIFSMDMQKVHYLQGESFSSIKVSFLLVNFRKIRFSAMVGKVGDTYGMRLSKRERMKRWLVQF